MLLLFILLTALVSIFVYKVIIKPLSKVNYLKQSFEKKGYKVLVLPLNFFKERIMPTFTMNFKKYGNSLYHFSHEYQDYDVIIGNTFNTIITWVAHPDLIKDAYNQIQNLPKTSFVQNNAKRMYGGGLLQSQGKQWRAKRKIYSQIFNFKLLEELHSNIDKVAEQTIQKWDISKPLDLGAQMRNILFNVFIISYFGKQFEPFSYKDMDYAQCLVKIFNQILRQSFNWKNVLFGVKALQLGLSEKDRQIAELLKVLLQSTKKFVIKRYEEIQKNNQTDSILSKIVFNEEFQKLSEQQRNTKMQQITGDILLFFFAGTDTTSTALTTTFHLLVKNPRVQQKLLKELEQNGNSCDPSNIKKLKYYQNVMNEVLRLYGPVNSLPRREVKTDNIKIGDVLIPKGVFLGVQTVTVHYSQKYYKNALQFRPERWEQAKNEHPFSFVSFGAGARNCIGQYLARMEYKIVLSKILKKFTFTTNQKLEMQFTIMYESANNKFDFKARK